MDQELIAYLDRRFDETSQQISTLREEVRGEMRTLREEMHGEMRTLREEMHTEIGTLREEMHTEIGTLREETHQRFEQVDSRLDKGEETARHTLVLLEDLQSDVHLLAEGVVGLSQRLDRVRHDDDFLFNKLRGWFEPYFRHIDGRV
jgi:chromosome segregation ATPase